MLTCRGMQESVDSRPWYSMVAKARFLIALLPPTKVGGYKLFITH